MFSGVMGILKLLQTIIMEHILLPQGVSAFSFMRKKLSIHVIPCLTTDKVNRIKDIMKRSKEERKACSAVFLEVAQAFDNNARGGQK